MLPDRVSNPGPLTYESGALPIALRGPAPGPKGYSELLPYQCIRRACCVVRQKLKTNCSNIFYKTTGPTVLKFHMDHDLIPGSQNVKFNRVEYPRWLLLLK